MLSKTNAGTKQDRIWRKQNEGTMAGVVEIRTRKKLLAAGEVLKQSFMSSDVG